MAHILAHAYFMATCIILTIGDDEDGQSVHVKKR